MKIIGLFKKFDKVVLEDISLDIPQKKVSIIVGINGSGKTTLLDCIVGLMKPSSGNIEINGYSNETEEFKKAVFYIPSDFYLPNYMTGYEYLDFVLKRYPNSSIKDIDKFLEIFDLSQDKNKLIESYSLGMKKKIQIIAAALANTRYIFGDEIFNGLDFETTLLCVELFNKLACKSGIILVSHSRMIIEKYPENILLLSKGKITPFKGSAYDLENKILNTERINEKIKFIQEYRITT